MSCDEALLVEEEESPPCALLFKVASKTCSGAATLHTCGTEVIDGEENPAAWRTRWLWAGSLNKEKFGPTGSPTSSVPWVWMAS